MKTASVRELRHQFNRVLNWVEHGEAVTITKRSHPIAILSPAQPRRKTLQWPDFKARLKKTSPAKGLRKPYRDIIDEIREERI